MDDAGSPGSRRTPVVSFGPNRRLALLALAVALIFGVLAILTSDSAGRILYVLAGLAGAAVGIGDLVLTPRLVVGGTGLRVRHGLEMHEIGWTHLASVAVDERTRHGLSNRTLEIDDGVALTILSRHALGADPHDAAGVIDAFRR